MPELIDDSDNEDEMYETPKATTPKDTSLHPLLAMVDRKDSRCNIRIHPSRCWTYELFRE